MKFHRSNDRNLADLRPVRLSYDVYGYADASLLFELGDTKVLTSVSLQQSVPPFLKGQRVGWLSAEYSMLPCATQQRTQRESSSVQKNARSVEISRLIGRSLRTVVDLNKIGERTILIDCDVLQADGGTRVASITAASLALELAIKRWADAGILEANVFKESVAAISVGVVAGMELVDLNFDEDKQAESDFNFVMTRSGNLIEIQGTSEKTPMTMQQFDRLKVMAAESINKLMAECDKTTAPFMSVIRAGVDVVEDKRPQKSNYSRKPGMFSLGNRVGKLQ